MTKRRSRRPLRLFWSSFGHWGLVINWSLVIGHWSLGVRGPHWSSIQRQCPWGEGWPGKQLRPARPTQAPTGLCLRNGILGGFGPGLILPALAVGVFAIVAVTVIAVVVVVAVSAAGARDEIEDDAGQR